MDITVIQGDIAKEQADALVNAAGTSLRMGSGVAGELRKAAGEDINQAAMEKGPIDLGAVAVTDAFDLSADYVIHAAAMPHYGDEKATETSIRAATRNALQAADELGCRSMVIPALGCGVAGFELSKGARIISEEVTMFDPANLDDVRLIGYSEGEYQSIREAMSNIDE